MQNTNTNYFIPINTWVVRDKPAPDLLERYFNDIYKLFICRLTKFDSSPTISEEDNKKLKALLDELIYVKTLLDKSS